MITSLFVVIAVVLLLTGFLAVVATTPWGQQLVTTQVNKYLATKIKSPFSIKRISFKLPDWIELENVYFQTPKGDTLLYGGSMRLDMDMLALLQNKVAINQVELKHIRLNVSRTLPDTTFNFRYLIDAFSGESTQTTVDTAATPLAINLKAVSLRDVRIKYRDDVTGADINTYVDSLRGEMDAIDLAKSQYRIRTINADGLIVKARIYRGLPTPESSPTDPADTLELGLGTWKLNRARWDVQVDDANFATTGNVGALTVTSDFFYLAGQRISLKSVDLVDSDITATLLKPTGKPAPIPSTATSTATGGGWQAGLGRVQFTNNRLRYDDQTAVRQPKGMDYGHLDLQKLSLTGRGLVYAPDRIVGQFRGGTFREKSGFDLRRLDGNLLYTPKQISLTGLYLQTGQSLLRDQLVLRYDSLAQLSNPRFARKVGVKVNLRDSKLSVNDVLLLAPFLANTSPFSTTKGAVIRATANVTGTLAALAIPTFDVAMLSGTRIRASGRLTNVTDVNRLGMDLTILDATTSRADLNKLVPPGTIPDSVGLPPDFKLVGRVRGDVDNLNLQANLRTGWGNATYNGLLKNFVAGKNQAYTGAATLTNFDAGKWLKNQKQYGVISANASFDGRGLDVKTMETSFKATVAEATLQGYRYQTISATGNIANGLLTIDADSRDPNARLAINGKVDLNAASPSLNGAAQIGRLDLQKLGFYADPLVLQGNVTANMTSTDPANPIGTITADSATVTLNGKAYPISALYLKADNDGGQKRVAAQLPFAQVALSGQFAYTQLYDILVGEISRYFAIPDLKYTRIPPPYSFAVRAKVYQDPLLRAFVPGLIRLDTVRLNGYLDNARDTTFAATMTTGVVNYDTTIIRNAALTLRAIDNALAIDGQIDAVQLGTTTIGLTELAAQAANNQLQFRVVNKDREKRDQYALAGQLRTVGPNYQLRLEQKGLLANYEPFTTDTTGYAQYGKEGVLINNMRLQSGNQWLDVASTEQYPNAPIRISAHKLELGYLARLAGQDTTLASGQLNGTVILRDYFANLGFTGNVYVDSLRVTQQPIGDLTARFRNVDGGRISVETSLKNQYNDANVTGFYTTANQGLNFTVDLKRLDARTIEAFSFGELQQGKGQLTGKIDVGGTVGSPRMDGAVVFDAVAFRVKQLNATYTFDQDKLTLSGQKILFDDFSIADTLGRKLTTNGTITLSNLPNARYDLRVNATNFQVLNATRKDNDYAYGKASVTARMRIRGAGTAPAVDGTVKLEDGSSVTALLPEDDSGVSEIRQTVTFISDNDTLALRKYLTRPKVDSAQARLAINQIGNMTVNLALEATDKSEVTIILDELNGDNLRARGNARLNVSMLPSGDISVLGRYDVTEGEYSLTYQVLKRQFAIEKGSSITFTGDPLKAQVDITAVYRTNALASDLLASETSGKLPTGADQKTPFEVVLKISENIASPKLSFDIRQPVDKSG
ncbi:MAG: translocation/assembly module TamB domain-containing protein, partial [Bacteroidetes bacterium]|nr:translocation/assembly module TamB domain-containing protein [Fibrella sp.]